MNSIFHMVYASDPFCVVLIMFLASVIVMFFRKYFCKYKFYNVLMIIGAVVYIGIIIYWLIINRDGIDGRQICLIPFYSYYVGFTEQSELFRECFMNAAFFFPLGLLLSSIETKKVKNKFWYLLGIAIFSFLMEVVQYIFNIGYAEIDDVIHNTFGAFCGIGFYYCFNYIDKISKIDK